MQIVKESNRFTLACSYFVYSFFSDHLNKMQSFNDKDDLSSNGGKLSENTSAIIGGSDKLIQPLLSCNNNNVNEDLSRCIEPVHLSKMVSVEHQNGYHSSNKMMFKDKTMEHVKLLVADQCSNESSSSTTPVSCMPPPPSYAAAVNTSAAVVIESDGEEDGGGHLKSCHAQRSNTCENCGQVVVPRPCDGSLTPVPPPQPTVVATSSAAAAPTPTNGVEVVVGGGLTKTSSGGSISSCSLQVDFCRICHCEADSEMGRLIAPCKCKGTLRNVHQACLQQWIKSSDCKHCELCGFHFAMNTKLKPISKWEKLSMSTSERRKIMCSVIFHLVAITCVVWSLYVLIERTAEELNQHKLQWPFWTKLVVVAIGFAGGLVFMYVQCKIYVQLWRRLKAFNRIIYVQHQPSSPSIDEQQQTTQHIVANNNQQPPPPSTTAIITTTAAVDVDDDDSRSAVVLLSGGGDKNASSASGGNSSSVAYQYHHQNNARQEEVVLVEVNPQS